MLDQLIVNELPHFAIHRLTGCCHEKVKTMQFILHFKPNTQVADDRKTSSLLSLKLKKSWLVNLMKIVVVKTSASRSHLGWNWIVVSLAGIGFLSHLGWNWIGLSISW